MPISEIPAGRGPLATGSFLVMEFDHSNAHVAVLDDCSYSSERDAADAAGSAAEATSSGRNMSYVVVRVEAVGGYTTYDRL